MMMPMLYVFEGGSVRLSDVLWTRGDRVSRRFLRCPPCKGNLSLASTRRDDQDVGMHYLDYPLVDTAFQNTLFHVRFGRKSGQGDLVERGD